MVIIFNHDYSIFLYLRQRKLFNIAIVINRSYFSNFQCKRKSFRTISNGNIQLTLRDNILYLFLLRRNDYLFGYDYANGNFRTDFLVKKSIQRKKSQVKVNTISKTETFIMWVTTIIVTVIFFFILNYFNTANIVPSTISVTTSFLAVYLTFRRSPYFAFAYAANDIVLIVLWTLASFEDTRYISVIVCFAAFFINDIYGFINWRKMKTRQLAYK